MRIRSFRDLDAWTAAMDLACTVDVETATAIEAQFARTGQLLHGILRSLRLQAASTGAAGALALIVVLAALERLVS